MIINSIFQSNETRVIPKQCFLIMPFGESWSEGVEDTVREILGKHEYNVLRADDMFGKNIMEDIWQGIVQSEFVICETTGRNPNVFYELGICHTLGKETVLLSQNADDIPFDVRHLRHFIYGNNISGFKQLNKSLEGYVSSRA